MTQKLKLTTMLLFVTLISFAQNVQKADTTKKALPTQTNSAKTKNGWVKGGSISINLTQVGNSNRKRVTVVGEEQEFKIVVKGDYIFTLSQATKTSNGTQNATIGPVQGVKVGLAKNPSGALIKTVTTNEKGEAAFIDLEIGSYKVVINPGEKAASYNPVKRN